MEKALIVAGWMSDPKHIELDEALCGITGKVEVAVRPVQQAQAMLKDIMETIAALPPGTRTKDDIDKQLQEERLEWGEP